MSLIVQKFGGTSVADSGRLRHVAQIITDTYKAGNQVVAVLSAQGDTTDELIEKAREINPGASTREMDMLLSTGEQISVALCAMAVEALGFPVVSLTGWQAGMVTNTVSMNARIKKVDTERIEAELDARRIVIVTGFQGINRYDDVTTLGRGGSDTSAVALAASLHADLCQIYTDVDGVYTADPRLVPHARKLDEVTYNEMLELATLGAQVLHNRSVEMAKKYNVSLEVLSSFSGNPGTKVKEVAKRMEKSYISSVAKDTNIARIALLGVPNEIGDVLQGLFPAGPAQHQRGHYSPGHRPRGGQGHLLYGGPVRPGQGGEAASGEPGAHPVPRAGDKCGRGQGVRGGRGRHRQSGRGGQAV